MKRIDAVREQTARWRRGRRSHAFSAAWDSSGAVMASLPRMRRLSPFRHNAGPQIISDISDVDDEVDGAHSSLVARHGQRVIAEIAVVHLIVIRLARKFCPTV